jgi:hypothetical protein
MVISSSLDMIWIARRSGSRTCLVRTASTSFRCLPRFATKLTPALAAGNDELASNVQLVDVSVLKFSELTEFVQTSRSV